MELELKKADISAYEAGGEAVVAQEETAETIVPDYCPDMARVIEAEGTVFLHSRELREGRAEIAGTARITVLYIPDGESGVRALEFSMPFTAQSDGQALEGAEVLSAQTRIEFLEARMINPRKLFTHCKLATRLMGWKRTPLCFATDVNGGEDLRLEKRRERQRAVLLTHIAEREFTFTDEMNLSPGRPGVYDLLSARVGHSVAESRIIGNKLIFKGAVSLALLYQTEDGACCSAGGELPFSQIVDASGAPEDARATITLQITGADIQVSGSDPDGRRIAVTLYFHALAFLRQERELELLTDLYSTAYEVRYEAFPLAAPDLYERQVRRQTVRELLEIGVVAEEILSVRVVCGPASVTREGDETVLRTSAAIHVLYRDEGGVPLVAERRVDVKSEVELPEGCTASAEALCPEEPQGSVGERGIEVRFPVDFHVEAVRRGQKLCLSAAEVDTGAPKDCAAAPSLVLRRMGREETAWDLAKACNSTIESILSANQIPEEGDLPRDQLLLIPRKRP